MSDSKPDLTKCPRCGARLEMIEGWREYGDRLVDIVVEGCMKCGYAVDDERDDDDEYDQ
jgi:Zn ribbon nucleic-acid-binding protein